MILRGLVNIESPFTGGKVEIRLERQKVEYHGDEFYQYRCYYFCIDTKREFYDNSLPECNVTDSIYNPYRNKHDLPYPKELTIFRERLGLSSLLMSQILGLSEDPLRIDEDEYLTLEDGCMPNFSFEEELKEIIHHPKSFMKYADAKRELLTDAQYEHIAAITRVMINKECDDYYLYLDSINLYEDITGIPARIWIDPIWKQENPQIKASLDDVKISMSISELPELIYTNGNIEDKAAMIEQIKAWVKLNQDILLEAWYDEKLSMKYFLQNIKKIEL